jgi:hypothetical protein
LQVATVNVVGPRIALVGHKQIAGVGDEADANPLDFMGVWLQFDSGEHL